MEEAEIGRRQSENQELEEESIGRSAVMSGPVSLKRNTGLDGWGASNAHEIATLSWRRGKNTHDPEMNLECSKSLKMFRAIESIHT
jgi:hypothetical protein